jgi:hypothetical protein
VRTASETSRRRVDSRPNDGRGHAYGTASTSTGYRRTSIEPSPVRPLAFRTPRTSPFSRGRGRVAHHGVPISPADAEDAPPAARISCPAFPFRRYLPPLRAETSLARKPSTCRPGVLARSLLAIQPEQKRAKVASSLLERTIFWEERRRSRPRRPTSCGNRPKHQRGLAESEQAPARSYFCSPRKAGVSSSRSTSLSKIVRSGSLERHESAIVGYRIHAAAASRVLAVWFGYGKRATSSELSFAHYGAEVTGTASSRGSGFRPKRYDVLAGIE